MIWIIATIAATVIVFASGPLLFGQLVEWIVRRLTGEKKR